MSVFPQTPQSLGWRGFAHLDPLLGLCPGPAGDLKRSPDPSPTHAPLIPNPGSAPVNSPLFSIFGTSPVLNARGTNHPRFSTFCLQIYFQSNFFISLLFHLFFLILTCSCQFSIYIGSKHANCC